MRKISVLACVITTLGFFTSLFFVLDSIIRIEPIVGRSMAHFLDYSTFAFLIIMILCLNATNNCNKGIIKAGILFSVIGIPFTFGISIIPLYDFVLKLKDCQKREENNKTTDANQAVDNSSKRSQYIDYVNRYKKRYIISIVLSSIYFLAFIAFSVFVYSRIFRNNADSGAVFGSAFAFICFVVIDAALLPFLVIGLVAPLKALIKPSRRTLKLNVVFGILDLTFVNSITSSTIIKEIEGIN